MIAQRLSLVLVPVFEKFLQGIVIIGGRFLKTIGLALVKFVTWVLTDFATVCAAAAIVWGVHFWSVPSAWVAGGVLTIIFVSLGVKPLR